MAFAKCSARRLSVCGRVLKLRGRQYFSSYPDDYVCRGELFPGLDLYKSDINLHVDGEWDRQLQLRGHLVGNRRNDHFCRCVYPFRCRKCNRHRDINRRLHQVRLGERHGDPATDDHVSNRFVQPRYRAGGSNQPMHSDR